MLGGRRLLLLLQFPGEIPGPISEQRAEGLGMKTDSKDSPAKKRPLCGNTACFPLGVGSPLLIKESCDDADVITRIVSHTEEISCSPRIPPLVLLCSWVLRDLWTLPPHPGSVLVRAWTRAVGVKGTTGLSSAKHSVCRFLLVGLPSLPIYITPQLTPQGSVSLRRG